MRLRNFAVALAFCITLAFSGHVLAADAAPKGTPQANCPVLQGKIDKKVFTDYKGKRIYFCCAGCIDDFKKDPEKYMKEMEVKGITLENAPEAK